MASVKKIISAVINKLYCRVFNCVIKAVDCVVKKAREIRYKTLRLRLKNTSPTIISSDCIGGVASHNLGLRFNSPTVNLFFEKNDFFTFVENLPGFLNTEISEVVDTNVNYPVGRMEHDGKKVDVFFMHYKSFEDAKRKWEERKKRVDFSNIYIIQNSSNATEQDIKRFEALPYKNKMLITKENPTNSDSVVTHSVFLRKDYFAGQILQFKSRFSLKRYMDDINWVSFLNSK